MKNRKINLWILAIVLTFLLYYNDTQSSLTVSSDVKKIGIQDSGQTTSIQFRSELYQSPTPIMVDGNADFHQQAIAEDWYLGGTRDGSAQHPYVISGVNITLDTPSLILINNTNIYFRLIDNFLNGKNISKTGIFLSNVTNAEIHNNTILNTNSSGIYSFNSTTNNITQNEISENTYNGILLEYSNKNRVIENNISYSNYAEEFRYVNEPYSGITLNNSAGNLLLKNNLFKNRNGIYLHFSDNNHIRNNTIYQNDEGILVQYNSNDNIIQGNTIHENRINHGIGVLGADNNTIIDNTVYKHNMGIDTNAVDNITINNNHVYDNQFGIVIWNTNNAYVKSNNVSDNNNFGISISAQSDLIAKNNSVIQNEISKNKNGIEVGEVTQFIFRANSTKILNNTIYENQEYGIKLTYAANYTNVYWNTFYKNALSKNSQAFDNGTNSDISNNTWHDWISPDVNNDGIVDNYYPVDGGANNFDKYPIVPKITFPDPPHSIIITTDGEIVKLEWSYPLFDGGSLIDAYHIYRTETSGINYAMLDKSTQLSFTDANILAGHTYYYVITSVNNFGESVFSNEEKITIPSPTSTVISSSTTTPVTSSSTTIPVTSSSTSTTSLSTSSPSITSAINPISIILSLVFIMIILRKRIGSK